MRKNEVVVVKIEHKVKKEDIMGLLDSASRGASYWAEQTLAWESDCNQALTPRGTKVWDLEEDNKVIVLNMAAIEKGLKLMPVKEPEAWADFINENGDDYTGDTFLQLCLFGKVIYS